MRNYRSDVAKVIAYVLAAFLLGALGAPWLYRAGMALVEAQPSAQPLKFLAAAAERAEFPAFFNRTALLAALLLIFPLNRWLRRGRSDAEVIRDTPWSLRRSAPVSAAQLHQCGQPLSRNPRGWRDFGVGFALGAVLLLLAGWLVVQQGHFVWKDAPFTTLGVRNRFVTDIHWGKVFSRAIPGALLIALIEEMLFRGLLLGIFLRAWRPAVAILLLSLLFAFLHFLKPPADVIADPRAPTAGLQLLGSIFSRFSEPLTLVSRFGLLTLVGVTLALARYRTASLWLPVGLHAGWVFGVSFFKGVTWSTPQPGGPGWWVGNSLHEGMLPLVVVTATAGLVLWLTAGPLKPRPPEPEQER